ncbi:hypothetical protein FGADI_170 [Fusarium gaditjirri]|uniref:NAD(P)-binding protein n=1 Tax=Fusarium gaditjirri TaxID=282569 RepID=A0A8H4X5B3_9HYPO|nr:hypothetical protein FGADI_170 [Fusarium gaditjirri]
MVKANGARAVYVLGRREEKLRNIASTAVHGRIHPIVADVSSKDSLAAAVEQVHQREGHINVLIANSGMIGPNVAKLFSGGETPNLDKLREALWDVPMEDFTQTLNLNVTAAFYTVVAFLDLLAKGNATRERTGLPCSQVIITTSISAFSRMPAAGFAYSASKAAATHLVKQLSTCFAPYKIRCNAIAPGFFPSEMTENMPWMRGSNPRLEGNLSHKTCPLERSGTEEDIAGQALFLTSKAGAYVNGCSPLTVIHNELKFTEISMYANDIKRNLTPLILLTKHESRSRDALKKVNAQLTQNWKNKAELSKTAASRKVRDGFIQIQGHLKKELQGSLTTLINAIDAFDKDFLKFPLRGNKMVVEWGAAPYDRWYNLEFKYPCRKEVTKTFTEAGFSKDHTWPVFSPCTFTTQKVDMPKGWIPYIKYRFVKP